MVDWKTSESSVQLLLSERYTNDKSKWKFLDDTKITSDDDEKKNRPGPILASAGSDIWKNEKLLGNPLDGDKLINKYNKVYEESWKSVWELKFKAADRHKIWGRDFEVVSMCEILIKICRIFLLFIRPH